MEENTCRVTGHRNISADRVADVKARLKARLNEEIEKRLPRAIPCSFQALPRE